MKPFQKVDDYVLQEKLGEGGMGVVYRCVRKKDHAEFAIKLLSSELLQDDAEREYFLKECKTLEQLKHPYILEVLDYGIYENVPYLVTEYCSDSRGRPMSLAVIQGRSASRRVEPYVLITVIPEMCSALAYIHQMGLIHHDIKPENVLIQEDKQGNLSVRLADFGLARGTMDAAYTRRKQWMEDEEVGRAVPFDFSGTYDYMSPEQLRGEPLDARSDVYSLGVTIYRIATGYDRLTPLRPSQVVTDVPEWVDDVVVRSAQTNKDRRCADGLELLYCLPKSLRPGGLTKAKE